MMDREGERRAAEPVASRAADAKHVGFDPKEGTFTVRPSGRVLLAVTVPALALSFPVGCGPHTRAVVSGGLVGSADTEHRFGSGTVIHVGVEKERIAVGAVSYEEIAYDETKLTRYSIDGFVYTENELGNILTLGWACHHIDTTSWGTGPRIGVGVSLPVFRDNVLPAVFVYVHLWLGSADDAFAIGVEGRVLAQLLLTF
jgi:hypothetical protein